MVVILAPAVYKICESFINNPLTRAQGNPKFLYLMGMHKECIANASEIEFDFGGGQHGCTCVAMDDQKYTLHYQIKFIHPQKRVAHWPIISKLCTVTLPPQTRNIRIISMIIIWLITWTVPWRNRGSCNLQPIVEGRGRPCHKIGKQDICRYHGLVLHFLRA